MPGQINEDVPGGQQRDGKPAGLDECVHKILVLEQFGRVQLQRQRLQPPPPDKHR
jgi:hypothetical protein